MQPRTKCRRKRGRGGLGDLVRKNIDLDSPPVAPRMLCNQDEVGSVHSCANDGKRADSVNPARFDETVRCR